jgi:DNA-binding transcriptional regulator GbsR (MarR family)
MGDFSDILKGPMTRLFEKLARWVGVSSNAGPVLAALFMEKYLNDGRLCSEDLCSITGYSRANAGLIVSQLEGLGVIEGQRDYDQTGRGRKRVLYTIRGDFAEVFSLGLRAMQDRLDSMAEDIEHIQEMEDPRFKKMLKEMQKAIESRKLDIEASSKAVSK